MAEVTCACGCGQPVKHGRTWVKNHNKRGKTGADAPNWKGGRHHTSDGYVTIMVDGKRVLEHRHVMEQMIGRPLTDEEQVHHENEIRDDNRPENLTLMSDGSEHGQIHRTMRRYGR